MGLRRVVLAENEIYHIFNKTSFNLPLFKNKRDYRLFCESITYYLQTNPPVKFSHYRKNKNRYSINPRLKLVTIICFCLMPNHFHFLIKQKQKDGIKKFIQRLCNSYAHFYNTKYQLKGSLFQGNFKAVRVADDEQLLHLSRYIHLNPVTSYITEYPQQYEFSSYNAYLGKENINFIDPSIVLEQFTSLESYNKFVLQRKDYQRELENIKHLLLE